MNFQQFQDEFNKLKLKYPPRTTNVLRSENADYGNYLYDCKNIYFCFDCVGCVDSTYLFDSFKAINCLDGDYVVESQNCYECIDVVAANNCAYIIGSDRIYDSFFCWDCNDCHDLINCVHLKNKQYCIGNKQYSEEEYKKKKEEILKKPIEENLAEMKNISMKFPVTITRVLNSVNSDYGNHVTNSKNLYLCFDCNKSEDSGYMYDSHYMKHAYDTTQCAQSDFIYECSDSARLNNCHHMAFCADIFDSAFCEDCSNSNHLFGCARTANKEYCILNKQYTKEEYEKQIKEIMDSYKGNSK